MACKACGEEPQKCNCKNHDSCMSPAVLEIVNEPEIVTFCKVVIPASAGDDKTNPPLNGLYRNALVEYEANGEAYLYSSDGIPTKITDRDTIERLSQLIAKETEDRIAADAKKAEKVTLYSDGNAICTDPALENILTFEEVKALTQDLNKIVVVHNDTYELRFEYHNTKGDDDAIWFNGVTSLNGDPYMYRIIINSDEEVKSDEYPLVTIFDYANANTAGVIKVGNNLTINENGVLSATGGGFDPYDRNSNNQPIGINITDAMATYIKLGNYARTDGTHDAISIGNNAHTTGQTSVSLGGYSEATGEQTTALGNNAKVYKYNSTAVGASAITGNNADSATAVGHDAQVYSQEGTAIGNQAVVNTNAYRGVAVGAGSVIYADAQKSVAISGKAKKDYSVALGYGAEARHSESVAIGYDSYTTRDREVSIGGRFLTGLTDGVNNNDAVTVSQLNTAVGNIETLLEAI